MTTIGINTRTPLWATFEVIVGLGLGGSLQLPYTALQLVLSENDLPTGNGEFLLSLLELFIFQSTDLHYSTRCLRISTGRVSFQISQKGTLANIPMSLSALGLSISQTLLLTNLQTNIPRLVPSISPQAIIQTGASNLGLLTKDPVVLKAIRGGWADAIRVVFILAVVASALSIPFACGLENLNVHVVAESRKEAKEL